MRRGRFLLLILFAVAAVASAQIMGYPGGNAAATAENSRTYTLSGTVVNSVTGEPIRRALVNVFYIQQFAMMTDSDGHFEFAGLPPGNLMVTAQKPGYFTQQELSGGRARPTLAQIGPDAPAVTLKLVPEAIIAGRILDPDGLPIAGLNVRAITQKVVNGSKQWQSGMIARTDGEGNYRISNLQPGLYFLVAGPGRALAFVARAGGNSGEMGYPPIVYPAMNSPLQVGAGEKLAADFSVSPEPLYSVSGSVAGLAPGGHYSVQLISQSPASSMPASVAPLDPESDTFTLPRVARGDYRLQAQGRDGQGKMLYGSIPISVQSNRIGVTIAMEPTMTIPVRIRIERTRQGPQMAPGARFMGAQVALVPLEENHQQAWSGFQDPKDPNSPMVLRNAVPGSYRVEVTPNFGDMYVQSATLGMTDLLAGKVILTQNANQDTIDIKLRDDGAQLMVKVTAPQGKNSVDILLVPDHGVPRLVHANGNPNELAARITGLRPAAYTVLAFQDIENIEYMNRAALEPYLSQGTKITLAPNQEATVTPELIKTGGE